VGKWESGKVGKWEKWGKRSGWCPSGVVTMHVDYFVIWENTRQPRVITTVAELAEGRSLRLG
jgi:hypothetical protein